MKKWTITRLVQVGFGAAMLVFALLAWIASFSMIKSLEMSEWREHSHEVLVTIEKINTSMALATTAHQAYLLSGEQSLLLQRDAALEALHMALNDATTLTTNDLQQQVFIQQARRAVSKRIEQFHLDQAARERDGLAGFLQHANNGEEVINADLQDILSQLVTEERRLLNDHNRQAQSRMQWAQTSGILLLVFVVAFLIAIYLLIRRDIQRDETRLALEKSEALLRQILSLLPVGVFVADKDGRLTLINPAAHTIWGTGANNSPMHKYDAWRLDTGKKVELEEYGLVRALRHGDVTVNEEFEIESAYGERRILRSSAMPLRDNQEQIIGAITVHMDVTDLKHTEQALQAAHDALEARVAMRTRELVIANSQLKAQIDERKRAEEALRHTQNVLTCAQRVAHVGSWEINAATRETQWSDEFFRICGLEPGVIAPSLPAGLQLIHPDDREKVASVITRTLAEGSEFKMTVRVVRPDGVIRHVLAQGELFYSNEQQPTMLIGSLLDVTEQKQNEEILRQLAIHQQAIKEDERKRIAREIHDEMGQNLMVLRIDVSMLHARTAHTHPKLHHKVDTVLNNIDNTIRSVRAIINNLRPVVLDLGLYAALQWQLTEFQRRSGILCTLDAAAEHLDQGLSETQTITLFRVVQESLTNVARHANASCVQISLTKDDEWLFMKIADDGVGIYPNERRKPKSFGLLGIRERISAIGGDMRVDSAVGRGTILRLSIPLAPMQIDDEAGLAQLYEPGPAQHITS